MNITKYIGNQFGNPTGIGGKLSTFIMNRMNQQQYNAVISALQIKQDETVLDIGFGNGYLLKKIAKKSPNALYYGIDPSEDMLSDANKRNNKLVEKKIVNLDVGDVSCMDFDDSFFDKIYSVNTIYFWPDLDKGLREIHRVLKNGGIFVNAVYSKQFLDSLHYTNYGFSKYTESDMDAAILRNGFEIVDKAMIKNNVSYCYVIKKV